MNNCLRTWSFIAFENGFYFETYRFDDGLHFGTCRSKLCGAISDKKPRRVNTARGKTKPRENTPSSSTLACRGGSVVSPCPTALLPKKAPYIYKQSLRRS